MPIIVASGRWAIVPTPTVMAKQKNVKAREEKGLRTRNAFLFSFLFGFFGARFRQMVIFFSNGQKFRVFLSLVSKFRNIFLKKIVKIRQILPAGSKNIERFWPFFIFIFSFSQSWLNCFMDDCHFGYVTKLERITLLKHSNSVFLFYFSSPILWCCSGRDHP